MTSRSDLKPEHIQVIVQLWEWVWDRMREGYSIDGYDIQDQAQEIGLLVEVPADGEFKAEWDSDVMLVPAWRAHDHQE